MWSVPGTRMFAALAAAAGCGFEVAGSPTPDAPIDVPPDMASNAITCKTLHAANPSAPSGPMTIDPDGPGGAAPFSAECDMTTDGGGWTIVFVAASPNLDAGPVTYSVTSPELFAEATSALIAYRDSALAASPGFASFPLPANWKTDTPFSYPQVDVITSVSINGATPVQATLRYGARAFGSTCNDPWVPTQSFGRLCVSGTTAPFFSAFSAPTPDACADSTGLWNARSCDVNTRFSIAIR